MFGNLFEKINEPVIVKDDDILSGVTFFQDDDGAFTLNSPSYFIKYPTENKLEISKNHDGFIIRTCISYQNAILFCNDYMEGIQKLSIIKNHILYKASKLVDLKECSLVTFKRPNVSGVFRERDNAAGFELRLYVKKEERVTNERY
jgi:hypothetical protein